MRPSLRSQVLLLVLLSGLGLLAASLVMWKAELEQRAPVESSGFAGTSPDRPAPQAASGQRILGEHAAAAAIGAVLLFLLWLALELQLARPARRVAGALERFEAGQGSPRTGIQGGEIGAIAAAFDALADRLDGETRNHRESRQLLECALESLPVGVIVVRRQDGRPLYLNARWRETYGRAPDPGRDILSILGAVRCERADGSIIPVEALAIPTVLRTGRPAGIDDLKVRREDGTVVRITSRAMPIRLFDPESFDAVFAVVEERAEGETPRRAPAARGPSGEEPQPLLGAVPRTATVLVVEDEAELLERASRALTEAGYRVLGAVDGDEALAVYRGAAGIIDAVVLDLSLPTKPGPDVLHELLDLDPATPVIVASGYHPDLHSFLSRGRTTAILAKPYGMQRLTATVRNTLERRRVVDR
ncbi:MAG TPA: response regulator [Candidatus Eisenbacteria bacterium]|jgi:two-component system response regulator PrrA